jgi:hypothetical protein
MLILFKSTPPQVTPTTYASYSKVGFQKHQTLGGMLTYAPVDTGRDYLAKEIISSTDDDGLKRLGKFYFDHFIRLCAYSLPMQ